MELGVEGFRVYGLQMQSFEHRAFFSGFSASVFGFGTCTSAFLRPTRG